MQKILNISNFAKAGINSDLMPWDLPGDFLTEIDNVRISRGKLSPFGGHSKWADLPVDFQPGYLTHTGGLGTSFWIIAGLDSMLVYNGSSFFDISSAAGYASVSNEDQWQSCNLSTIVVLNNPSHFPEYWPQQNVAVVMTPLPWDALTDWDTANESARVIRSHKQFLFALDLVSQGINIPDGVRWSSPADIGGVPETWDPLDITNVAGITNLAGDGGTIIDGLSLRDAFVVYRESGISVFDYVGGQFVWQIRHLSTTIGLVSTDCIVEVKGRHYFIGDGDILVNDGNTITSLLHNRLRKRFVSDYDADNFYNSYAVKNNVTGEIWFCIPESGHVYPNIAYVFNWEDNTWSIRRIPDASHANYGTESSPSATWADTVGQWLGANAAWGQRQLTPMDDTVIACTKPSGIGQQGTLLLLDVAESSNISPYKAVIERVGFPLEGLNNTTTITRIYPHMRGPGTVEIEVGSQDFPGAPVRWKPAVVFEAGKERKVDIRSTGELHCFRISADSVKGYWEVSGIDVEYSMAGLR